MREYDCRNEFLFQMSLAMNSVYLNTDSTLIHFGRFDCCSQLSLLEILLSGEKDAWKWMDECVDRTCVLEQVVLSKMCKCCILCKCICTLE